MHAASHSATCKAWPPISLSFSYLKLAVAAYVLMQGMLSVHHCGHFLTYALLLLVALYGVC